MKDHRIVNMNQPMGSIINFEAMLKDLQITPHAELFDFLEAEQEKLLLLVMNAICDKWYEIEAQDPDQSTKRRNSYKRIRNNTRGVIIEIAKSKEIKL